MRKVKKVLIAVDKTTVAKNIVSTYLQAVRPLDTVFLVYVEQLEGRSLMIDMLGETEMSILKESMKGTPHKESLDREARKTLAYYRKKLEKYGNGNIRTVIREGRPAEEILEVAEEEAVDLIIMGCGGKTSPSRLISGCATNEVEKFAKVPVLVAKNDGCQKHVYGWREEVYAAR
jgi:nucleotide-binding universal stress UspA family protein